MTRSASRLRDVPWADSVEVAEADALDADSLVRALARRGRGVLPDPLHRHRRRLRGDRPPRRDDLRRGGPGRRRRPDRLPRRARRRGRQAVRPPALALRGRPDPAGVRGADGGAASRRDHRLRVGVVRDAALPHRAAAGDDLPAVGQDPDAADRDPGRASLPGRLRRTAARRQPDLRHRRPGRADLPGDDAALRPGGRPAPPAHPPGPAADPATVGALGQRGHAGAEPDRPAAGGQPGQRGGRRRARHRPARPRPAGGPAGDRPRPGAGAGEDPRRPGGDQVVRRRLGGRAQRPAADRPGVGRRHRSTSTSAAGWSSPTVASCGG